MRIKSNDKSKWQQHAGQTNVWVDKLDPIDRARMKMLKNKQGLLTPRFMKECILHYLDYLENKENDNAD